MMDISVIDQAIYERYMVPTKRKRTRLTGLEFESVDEILCYIRSMSLYCVERNGKYINFPPVPLTEYFASELIEGEYFDGDGYRKILIHPELSDLKYLRSFKFEDLTFRGTVEFRSVCEQPAREMMEGLARGRTTDDYIEEYGRLEAIREPSGRSRAWNDGGMEYASCG